MSPDSPVTVVSRLLRAAIEARLFSAASMHVGSSTSTLCRAAFGTASFESGAPLATTATIFDLASLTKPLATTGVALELEASGAWALDDAIAMHAPEWTGPDRAAVTLVDLLEHASGLSARLPDVPPEGRREFEHEICTMPLEYPPRSRSIYSDLGFILLGFCAERAGGAALDTLTRTMLDRCVPRPGDGDAWIGTAVPPDLKARTAATAPLPEDRRRRTLVGEVHDNYAAMLGGFAGHAGLFGSADGVAVLARAWLRAARGTESPGAPVASPLATRALRRSTVPGSSRALGWDTMRTTSSCGSRLSPAAFGHVGFTGTSLWIDPALDRYFILLTNRAIGAGSSEAMQDVRRAFHDALVHI